MSKKEGDIIINVETNENKIPQKIKWTATEANIDNKECKAMFLALWDKEEKHALRMDLWTGEMMVDEMKMYSISRFSNNRITHINWMFKH